MAPCSASEVGDEVGNPVSVPVEVTTMLGLAILIITVGPVVSLVMLVVFIHSGTDFLGCLFANALNCERSVLLKDC